LPNRSESSETRETGPSFIIQKTWLSRSRLKPTNSWSCFCGRLDPLLPTEVRIFAKVGLDDIFGVKSGLERGARQSAVNKINRKHVDFLLVRATDLVPLAGIELDDSSHEAEDRRQRDVFVDAVFKSGGIPLLNVPAQESYNPAVLKSKVAALLS